MLDAFETWVKVDKWRFEELNISIEWFKPEQDKSVILKQSARVRFETDDFISDIGVWDSGECDVEVLDCETAEHILFDTHEFDTIDEMNSALDEVREYLINLYKSGV